MIHARLVLAFAAAAALACAPEAPGPLAGAYAGHNLILISVDTLRADHLGTYGHERPTSPRIDAIAAQGVVFERAYAPVAATWPSLVSMVTSLRPHRSNVRINGELMADDVPTLATILKGRGYSTGAFVANACDAFERDFDVYGCAGDRGVNRGGVAFLNGEQPEPFFLWLHYLAPHEEYRPPMDFDLFTDSAYDGPFDGNRRQVNRATLGEVPIGEADREHVLALYDGEVRYVDALLAELWHALTRLDLVERTVLVVTADHGEELGDHHDYFYHICSVHEPALRIPLMIRLPDGRSAGRRVDALVENVDLVPTLLELLGEPLPEGLDGTSRVALMEDGPESAGAGAEVATSEFYRPGLAPILSLRTDRWRYVYNPAGTTPLCVPKGDFYRVAKEELYDHRVDPREARNVVAEHPDVAAELRAAASLAYRPERRAPAIHARPKTMENLRALGYVVE